MPIPENPQSRSEQYLNAIATGDNSGLPEFPQSRMEQYLDYIAQNGGGYSGGGVLVVHAVESGDSFVCDKTGAEMNAALTNGIVCIHMQSGDETQIRYITIYYPDGYEYTDNQADYWVAASANDYPVIQ